MKGNPVSELFTSLFLFFMDTFKEVPADERSRSEMAEGFKGNYECTQLVAKLFYRRLTLGSEDLQVLMRDFMVPLCVRTLHHPTVNEESVNEAIGSHLEKSPELWTECAKFLGLTVTLKSASTTSTLKVTQKYLDSLPEYSCSLPTGTEYGKRWKRKKYYYDASKGYVIGEYGISTIHGEVPIFWYEVEIIEEGSQEYVN